MHLTGKIPGISVCTHLYHKTSMQTTNDSIILYTSEDGQSSVTLYARDGSVWLNQLQMAELFATSRQNIGKHIANILKDRELREDSVVKNYFTTASDGKKYKIINNLMPHEPKRRTCENSWN